VTACGSRRRGARHRSRPLCCGVFRPALMIFALPSDQLPRRDQQASDQFARSPSTPTAFTDKVAYSTCWYSACQWTSFRKGSNMARGIAQFTYIPLEFIYKPNEPNMSLLSHRSWSSFADRGRIEGWVGLGVPRKTPMMAKLYFRLWIWRHILNQEPTFSIRVSLTIDLSRFVLKILSCDRRTDGQTTPNVAIAAPILVDWLDIHNMAIIIVIVCVYFVYLWLVAAELSASASNMTPRQTNVANWLTAAVVMATLLQVCSQCLCRLGCLATPAYAQ